MENTVTTRQKNRSLWASVLGFAMLAGLSACAADALPEEEVGVAEISNQTALTAFQFEWVSVDGRFTRDGGKIDPGLDPVTPCDCETSDCLTEWVNDTFGCDVCVSFECNGEHVCNPCEDSTGPAPIQGGDGAYTLEVTHE